MDGWASITQAGVPHTDGYTFIGAARSTAETWIARSIAAGIATVEAEGLA